MVVVTRHGDRTPVYTYDIPNDSVEWNCTLNLQVSDSSSVQPAVPTRIFQKQYMRGRELLAGNCMLGQLTERGATQHQGVGAHMKALYIDKLGFLSPSLDASELSLRSTDVERTLLSAYNLIRGMYPDSGEQVLPIMTIDDALDNGSPNTGLCPALKTVYAAARNSSAYQKFYQENLGPLAIKYGALWNRSLTGLDFNALNDISRARFCHGYEAPTDWTMDDLATLWHAQCVLDNMEVESFDAQRFGSGSYMQDILASFNEPQKFQLFSAHDSTLRSLLYAMIEEPGDTLSWPAYASHFTMEAWQTGSD